MKIWTIAEADEEGIRKLGAALAQSLPETGCLALDGPLGAGKTFLVRALAAAAGVDPAVVTSPTFVLVKHYLAERRIHHVDFYRLRDEDEARDLGLDELPLDGLLVVEWAERFSALLPAERLEIRLTPQAPHTRRVEIAARGMAYERVLEHLSQRA